MPLVPPSFLSLSMQLKDAIASFASTLGQGKAAPEVVEAISRALAEKAVVMEHGKPVEGLQVWLLGSMLTVVTFWGYLGTPP